MQHHMWHNVKDFIAGAYYAYIIQDDDSCTKWETYMEYIKKADASLPCAYHNIVMTASNRFVSYILAGNDHNNTVLT
jgi:hypothetical protein